MTLLGLFADGLVIVLLAAALLSIYRLNRRMTEMRDGRAALEKLTADLAAQTKLAADGLTAFRANAETLGKQLESNAERGRQVIAEVQRAADDVRLLIARADGSSTRLEQGIAEARRSEAVLGALEDRPGQERKPVAPAPRGLEPQATEVSSEAAAFLSSLSGMR